MDLKLANTSHASVFVLFLPRIDCLDISSKFEDYLYSHEDRIDKASHVKNYHLFLLIHATAGFDVSECWNYLNYGYYSFVQKYDIIFSASVNTRAGMFEYTSHTFGDEAYSGCGDIPGFFESLARRVCLGTNDGLEIPKPANVYLLDLIKTRSTHTGPQYSSQQDFRFHLDRIFNSPELIQQSKIENAKGQVCLDVRYMLAGMVNQHQRHHYFHRAGGVKVIPQYESRHYNVLEHTLIGALCIYKDARADVYRIGCRVCSKCAMSSSHDGYNTVLEALSDCERVGIAHGFYVPFRQWDIDTDLLAPADLDSSTSQYCRITTATCNQEAINGVAMCTPPNSALGGCLGLDQFVASSIDNEMVMLVNGESAENLFNLHFQMWFVT
jgi:hypothetical protein